MRLADAYFRDIPNRVQLLDYGTRTDGQPEYLGYAAKGSSEDSAVWVIIKFTYDASNFLTQTESVGEAIWSLKSEYFT